MAKIENIVSSIEALSDKEFTHLRQWFADRDQEKWDRAIQKDSDAGRLDFLLDEAAKGRRSRQLKPI